MANWSNTWDALKALPPAKEDETELVTQAQKDFTYGKDYEAQARVYFDYDLKFANGDSHNKYQWDNDLVTARELEDKPCLTINKVQQHNLMVINDAKQNKPGIRIRPVGDDATYEGAQIYQELVYHIEYISSAENVYDSATTFQVQAGIGYWRVDTDYISDKSFDQEIYIRHIKDPRSVYLDPDINEIDGSDARWGLIFEDMAKDLFKKKHPKFASIASASVIGNNNDGWITRDHVRVALYFYKEEKEDKLVTWINGEDKQIVKNLSELDEMEELLYKQLKAAPKQAKELYEFRERKIVTENIKWCKIAGDRIIENGDWLGKYIPIVRLVGTETVIDGVMDRKGHTRSMINAQQIYNFMSSSNVEFISTQSKTPWVAPVEAIENFEEYYKTANRVNHSYLPYNGLDDEGNTIAAPTRNSAIASGNGYVQQMQVAQNELMMASGQYQAQFGEAENAKSGVAINARQRQGDKATYHFIDNQAVAIRYTGKILIDLIPKVYDTPRIKKILAQDGNRINVKIDTDAKEGLQNVGDPNNPLMDNGQKVKEVIFNPDFGMYDIQADTGPSYATKRMETATNMMELIKADEKILAIGGDILVKNMDFAGADVLALRMNNMLSPQVKGEGLPPEVEQSMHQASDMIQMLQGQVGDLTKKLEDKEREHTEKGMRLDLDTRKASAQEAREDYKAESDRLAKIFNTSTDGSGIDPALKQVMQQLIQGMIVNGELQFKDEEPPVENARKAKDGQWYVEQDGGFARVEA